MGKIEVIAQTLKKTFIFKEFFTILSANLPSESIPLTHAQVLRRKFHRFEN